MVQKRKRNASPISKTQKTQHLNSLKHSPWDWVGTEVTDSTAITPEHRQRACGFSPYVGFPFCRNKAEADASQSIAPVVDITADQDDQDTIIVLSDSDEEPECSKKTCKSNPNCLNYLGQDKWLEEESAREQFTVSAKLGSDPADTSRKTEVPVGLKNLGATCYANASLQVWYRDLAFREGVYLCRRPEDTAEDKYEDSPIFQLQTTFAALQLGNQRVFNPTRLVESLQLRTAEQQDAQEFSKLFMSHLDSEFKRQALPSLKSLINDQFQGSLIYGTRCHDCGARSERPSDFLELEITLATNCKLEDRISAALASEILLDDNRYFCSTCDGLRDATRYTELATIPPVLHFSLMRFVYDLSTMERRKSKCAITFPRTLDMAPYLTRKEGDSEGAASSSEIYELRGVLLHKGPSAYHGHYEAQIKDNEADAWFLFNDDVVTKIQSLSSSTLADSAINTVEDDELDENNQVAKKRANAKKRRRIPDSEDEVVEVPKRQRSKAGTPKSVPSTLTSKDAYMLIYAKKSLDSLQEKHTPQPPPKVLAHVQKMNDDHTAVCQQFEARRNQLEQKFQILREKVLKIIASWTPSQQTLTPAVDPGKDAELSEESTIIASRQAIESWLDDKAIEGFLLASTDQLPESEADTGTRVPVEHLSLSLSDIVCDHGLLDPEKAQDMKQIVKASYDSILRDTHCQFTPLLHSSNICEECTANQFQERLYDFQHPLLAKRFDDICRTEDLEDNYWISKKWCRDWRLVRPRMHTPLQSDPAPDSGDFYGHVRCEHGNLSLNATSRRKISREAMLLLKELFPSWDPPSTDAEDCVICESSINISKEDKKEVRKKVELEKLRLSSILDPPLDLWRSQLPRIDCAAVPSTFIKHWKRWVQNPSSHERPEAIDTGSLLCDHSLLIFDPNHPGDLESITIVEKSDWDALQDLYSAGPLIALTKEIVQGTNAVKYHHETLVCADCRTRTRTEWDSADIFVRLWSSKELSDVKSGSSSLKEQVVGSVQNNSNNNNNNATRQSRRLRNIRHQGERRKLNVSKLTSIKDIKIMIQKEFNIPTICQQLSYQGQDLDDNNVTVGELQILAHDVLDLKEFKETINVDTDSDEEPSSKRRREEGPAFGGTLLLGSFDHRTSSPEVPPSSQITTFSEKTCSKCTYVNPSEQTACDMCESALD